MLRIFSLVVGILIIFMIDVHSSFSYTEPIHDDDSANQIINHSGTTDSNGCHEDGSGGYHCH